MARVTKHAVRLNHLLLAAPRRRITSRHTVRRPLTHLPAATCAALVRHNPLIRAEGSGAIDIRMRLAQTALT